MGKKSTLIFDKRLLARMWKCKEARWAVRKRERSEWSGGLFFSYAFRYFILKRSIFHILWDFLSRSEPLWGKTFLHTSPFWELFFPRHQSGCVQDRDSLRPAQMRDIIVHKGQFLVLRVSWRVRQARMGFEKLLELNQFRIWFAVPRLIWLSNC